MCTYRRCLLCHAYIGLGPAAPTSAAEIRLAELIAET